MYSLTHGYFYPKFNKLNKLNKFITYTLLLLLLALCFSAKASAEPLHQAGSSIYGYENESGASHSGSDWSKLPRYNISQTSPAHINSYISRQIVIKDEGQNDGDKILIRFYNPDNEKVRESRVNWTGTCWTLVFSPSCMGEGWWVEAAEYVGNEIGLWTIETIDLVGGVEILISQQTVEVKGREMAVTSGANLTVYENDNSRVPLEIMLIDYDHESGTSDKEITYEVIHRPKGKASGGLNYVYLQGSTFNKRDTLNGYTNFDGKTKAYWESGAKPGTYIVEATSYWSPENPVQFQITVKEGKDPNKEDDLISELVDMPRNNGKPSQCEAIVGNPINVITGNKYQQEIDYQLAGTPFPLEFVRYYNSRSTVELAMGPKWSYSYSRFITTTTEMVNGSEETVAKVQRDNGQVVKFYKNRKSWLPVYQDINTSLSFASKKWAYINNKGHVEEYDQLGKLQTITLQDSNVYTIEYNVAGKLSKVISPSQHDLRFYYNEDGKIDQVGANNYYYNRMSNGMLTKVNKYGGLNRYYLYEDEQDISLLTSINDDLQQPIANWQYNDKGQAILSSHGQGTEQYTIDYQSDGSRSVINPDGSTSQYLATGQHGLGFITNVDGPACSSGDITQRNYNFDPNTNNLLSKTINNQTTRYGDYNQHGQPGYIIEGYGSAQQRQINFKYDAIYTDKISVIEQDSVSGNKQKTLFEYDQQAHLISVSQQGFEPNGSVISKTTRYQYNGILGQLSSIDGPRTDINDVYNFNYYPLESDASEKSRLKDVIAPDGTMIKSNLKYTYSGHEDYVELANGTIVTREFDKLYNLTNSTHTTAEGDVRLQTYTYDLRNNVISITTAGMLSDEHTTYFSYDNADRLTRISNDLGDYLELTLDNKGNIIGQSSYGNGDILQSQITQAFDAYDNPTSQFSENQSLNSLYNSSGLLVEQTNANAITKRYSYDALQRLSNIINDVAGSDSNTAETEYKFSYDVNNNPTQVTDANGNTTFFSFDDFNNKLNESSPDKGTWSFRYDKAGNTIQMIDAKQQVFDYQYDANNRLTQVSHTDSNYDISYLYDTCSNNLGKVCEIVKGDTQLTYSYNGFGDIIEQQQTISTNNPNTINTEAITQYTHDLAGRVNQITYPSGNKLSYQYDKANNITAITVDIDGVSQNLINNAHYDFTGQIKELTFANGANLVKQYDLAGRVVALANGSINEQYSFDGVGNLISQQQAQSTNSNLNEYSFDALNRLLTTDSSNSLPLQSYQYDKNGNRTSQSINSVITNYDIASNSNALIGIDNSIIIERDENGNTLTRNGQSLQYSPYNQLMAINNVASYQYNGLGQRISKTNLTNNISQYFVYNLAGQLISELDSTGNPVTEHIYLNNMPIAVIKYEDNNSQIYYVHTDHLNTPRAITNQSQQEIWQWQSDAFGNGAANSDVNLDGKQFIYNKRFPGQYYDQESGLHYNYYRDYDPQTGRYIQSDPIGLNGGMNTFAYVGGNPLMYIDPKGLARWTGRIEMFAAGEVIGGAFGRAILTSDCDNGKRWNVQVNFSAGGSTVGFPWSLTASKIELNDPYPAASPINLVGDFSYSGFNVAALLGYGSSIVQIGQAYSVSSGLVVGVDLSWADFTLGESSVSDAFESECGCNK